MPHETPNPWPWLVTLAVVIMLGIQEYRLGQIPTPADLVTVLQDTQAACLTLDWSLHEAKVTGGR